MKAEAAKKSFERKVALNFVLGIDEKYEKER